MVKAESTQELFKRTLGIDVLVMPGRPHNPFTDVTYLFSDMLAKYGDRSIPAEQRAAIFKDAPPELLGKFTNEQLGRIAFDAQFLAEQHHMLTPAAASQSREPLTQTIALNMLKSAAEHLDSKAA